MHSPLSYQGGNRDVGSIWSEVHTLSYRPYAAAMRLRETEAATSVIAPGGESSLTNCMAKG